MEPIQITEATENDIPVIRQIALAAWPATYSKILSAGQLEYMLGTLYSPAELKKQVNTSVQFLLACHQQRAIGFAGFGPYENDYKLYKIYIHPDATGTGVGKSLLQEVINRCTKASAQRLILNVHRKNPARSFYEKHGFRIYETKDIPFGPDFVLNDYLMEKTL